MATAEERLAANINKDKPDNLRDVTPQADGVTVDEMAAPLREKHRREANVLRAQELSPENAYRLAILARQHGVEGLGEERFQKAMGTLRAFEEANPGVLKQIHAQNTQGAEQTAQEQAPQTPSRGGPFNAQAGLLSAAAVVGNSAIAEPIAGLRALWTLAKTRGDVDAAVEAMESTREALTFVNPTENGEKVLNTIAVPLMKLDEGAGWIAEKAGMGNPYASTFIYTGLVGGADVLGIKGGRSLRTSKKLKDAQKLTEELGVAPNPQTMPSDIVRTARDMAPEVRAANAGELQDALQQAHRAELKNLERLRRRANEEPAFLNTKEAQTFASEFRRRAIEDGWDLEQMPTLARRLEEIEGLPGRVFNESPTPTEAATSGTSVVPAGGRQAARVTPEPAAPRQLEGPTIESPRRNSAERTVDPDNLNRGRVQEAQSHLQDWITLSNRVEKDILSRRNNKDIPETTNEVSLLNHLSRSMDDALEKQFHSDLIDGTPEALQAWKLHQEARGRILNNFNADRTITKLIDMEASPEEIKRWVMGASGVNANKQMQATVTRMKEILGRDHPAIEGVRQDFLFDVLEPLMLDEPNLQKFVNNVDNVVRRQSHVLKALDITPDQLMPLRNLAKTSMNNPPSQVVKIISDAGLFISRFTVGHQIAKKAMKVSMMANLWRRISGQGRATQKQVLADFAGAQFGGPVFDKASVAAGRAIQGAFLADIGEAADEDVEQEK